MGTVMKVILEGDGAWPDLREATRDGRVIHLDHGSPPIQVAYLPEGTVRGEPSVTIRVDLPDGRVVLAETTLALFLQAADLFRARHRRPPLDLI